jgi:putative tryptophan/tyrosine transport system substrate-binding protein
VPVLLVALTIVLLPVVALAQAPARVPTVGVLSASPGASAHSVRSMEAFERGLKELGWIPGQTIRIEYRHAEGRSERLDELARDLVRARVDLIVARATNSIQAAKRATTSTPIVMSAAGYDPVQLGLVASLARPGGNVTGLTLLTQELPVKQLELLKQLAPGISRVAVLGSAAVPPPARGSQELESAARALGIELHHVEVERADDLDEAFAGMVRARAGGLLVRADAAVLEANDRRIVALALRHKLPAVYWLSTYPQIGGLMSYGPDLFEVHRRAASYVDRILRGARPADLPIEEPTKFSLLLNVKTARALGLTFPPSIVARANDVIE